MGLEAGSVWVKIGGLFNRSDFDKWDSALAGAKTAAKTPINATLGADTTGLDKDITAAGVKVTAFGTLSANADLSVDDTKALAKITSVEALIEKFGNTKASAILGIDGTDALVKYAELDALRIKWSQAKATATFDIDTKQATAALAAIQAKMLAMRKDNPFAELQQASSNAGVNTRQANAISTASENAFLNKLDQTITKTSGNTSRTSSIASPSSLKNIWFGNEGSGFQGFPSISEALGHLPGFGSLGSLAGFGPEHFALTGAGILGSAGTALAGAGVYGAGAGLKEGVTGGANYLVGRETDKATEALYKSQTAYNTAVKQFGANSTQAAQAQLALNNQMATYGKVAGTAELKTAKMAVNLRAVFDADTQQAQASKSRIYQGFIGVADTYAKPIGRDSNQDFLATNKALQPLEDFLKGSQGHNLFDQLESDELKSIPKTIDTITQAVEYLLKFLTQVDNESAKNGGVMDKLDKFFTKRNNQSVGEYDSQIAKLTATMHLWGKTGVLVFDDIKDALKFDGGTSRSLITEVDGFLEQLNKWETSPAGQRGLTNLFTAHREEFEQLLRVFDGFAKGYGTLEVDSGPGIVKAVTAIIKVFADLLHVVSEVPGGAYVIGLGLVLDKLHLLGPALKAAKLGVMGLTGAMDVEGGGSFLSKFGRRGAASDVEAGVQDAESSGGKGNIVSRFISGAMSNKLTGVKGAGIGSAANPLAVVVIAGEMVGEQGISPKITEETGEESDSELSGAANAGGNLESDAVKATETVGSEGVDTAAAAAGAAGIVGAAANDAPAAVEELAPEATGLLSKAAGALSGIAGNLGKAGIVGIGGTLASKLAGDLVGGKAGKDVSSIGSDASLGAAIGTAIEPGIGTAVGAALGGVGGAIKTLLFGGGKPHRTTVERQSDDVTQNSRVDAGLKNDGVSRQDLNAEISALLKSADKLDQRQHSSTQSTSYGRFGSTTTTTPGSNYEVAPKISTASGREAIADQEKAGKLSAQAFVDGYSSYKYVSEPQLFRNFKEYAAKLPPWMQVSAVQTVEQYAKGMESQGTLIGGTAKALTDQINGTFSQLSGSMGTSATNAVQTLASILNSDSPAKSATNMVQQLSTVFSNIAPDVATTGNQMQVNWNNTWTSLENDTKVGSSNSRTASKSALSGLVSDANTELSDLPTLMGTLSAQGTKNLAANFAKAASAVQSNMTTIGSTTKKGMQLVNSLTTGELKTLGYGDAQLGAVIKDANAASASYSKLAGGGMIPGGFGLEDNMTLYNPAGEAVALMAGDEGIINRHQMPVINDALAITAALGLGSYGSLDEVWGGVTRPHGYAVGGALPLSTSEGSNKSSTAANSHLTKLMAAANKVSSANFPYAWGGGHEQPAKFQPFDCSGTVSYLTQQAGYNVPTETAGSIGNWGFPRGKGGVTIYYTAGFPGQAAHTFMDIEGRYFGTSGFARPNGGAGWFDQQPSASYLSGFNTVHLPDIGGASSGSIPNIKVGGSGYDQAISQTAISKAVVAANKKIQSASSALMNGGGGGGDAIDTAVVPSSLKPYNKQYPMHYTGTQGTALASSVIGQIATWAGMPASDFIPITQHESNNEPGIVQSGQPYSKTGWGLTQITPGDSVPSVGKDQALLNPLLNFKAASVKYRSAGLSPWLADLEAGVVPGGAQLQRHAGGRRLIRHAGGNKVGKSSISSSVSSKNRKASTKQAKKLKSLLSATTNGSNNLPGNLQWITKLASQFTADDDKVAQMNNVYNQENQLYSLYDNSSTGSLPQQDLQTLVGNQESQWDIYMKEIQGSGKSRPGLLDAIGLLQKEAKSLIGSPSYKYVYGKGDDKISDGHVSVLKKNSLTGHHKGSGLDLTLQTINSDSALVKTMSDNLRIDTQKSTVKKDKVSAKAQAYAEEFRKRLVALTAQMQSDANASLSQTERIAALTAQLRGATTGTKVTSLTNQIQSLQNNRSSSSQSQALQERMTKLQNAQASTGHFYAKEGFYTAWAHEVSTYNIQSSIDRLKQTIANLKMLVAAEQKDLEYLIGSGTQLGAVTGGAKGGAMPIYATSTSGGKVVGQNGSGDAAGGLLQDLQYRYYGSPDGTTSSIFDTMETIGYNIVDLVQQGAQVPASMITQISDLFKSQGVSLPVNWSSTASGSAASQSASSAWSDFVGFQSDLSNIFQQYGSNFAAAGSQPLRGAGLFAGTQNYGAAQGNSVGMSPGATSGTTVNITQNYASGPTSPLTYASSLRSDIGALV